MADYQVKTTLTQDGVLTLTGLPFSAGTKVKVTVREVKETRDTDAETAAYYQSMTPEEQAEEDAWIRLSSQSAKREWDEE